ncbi:hypothetical protein HPP92_002871 [Vanilla planifolia]|uniref:Phytocyanin domain-containing protein n=1 Tax=Vanilla planifolia TaxID=51239 RepID=A0A835S738_VANPL|nr:hypothetical protein HPP92_003261 [Vanilla planifolia]KAG0502799.1 hypothetical protein HPP92_002871 [Vanilla planifolia]
MLTQQMIAAAMCFLFATNTGIAAYQFKVGDLNAWGVPPSSIANLYLSWSLNHSFHIGDSLLFLYPPSQDSVIQVTERAFNTCVVADPIIKMGDGNSVFNLTSPGNFYFTSGVPGHCQKGQKLHIAVPNANGTFFPPSPDDVSGADGPAAVAGGPSSYPLVFGPNPPDGSAAPGRFEAAAPAVFGSAVAVAILCCIL